MLIKRCKISEIYYYSVEKVAILATIHRKKFLIHLCVNTQSAMCEYSISAPVSCHSATVGDSQKIHSRVNPIHTAESYDSIIIRMTSPIHATDFKACELVFSLLHNLLRNSQTSKNIFDVPYKP